MKRGIGHISFHVVTLLIFLDLLLVYADGHIIFNFEELPSITILTLPRH